MKKESLQLVSLTETELTSIEGGSLPSWLKGFGWSALIMDAIKNWDEIKKGFMDGWHFPDKH